MRNIFEQLEKGLSASPLPIANQAKEFCGYMQRNVTTCRTPS